MATKFPIFSKSLNNDPTIRRLWFRIATSHDFERYDKIIESNIYIKIWATHFGQLTVIFIWTSGTLFHVALQGNFEIWIYDPLRIRPIAHIIFDLHYRTPAVAAYILKISIVNVSTSGMYQWWYTIGIRNSQDLYQSSIFCVLLQSCLFSQDGFIFNQSFNRLYCGLKIPNRV